MQSLLHTLSDRSDTPAARRVLLLLLIALGLALPVRAQEMPGAEASPVAGTVHLTDWPARLLDDATRAERDRFRKVEVLPFLDTLALGYRLTARPEAPALDLTLAWTPGPEAFFEGRRVPYDALPDSLVLTGLELQLAVVSAGQQVATLIVGAADLRLEPRPQQSAFGARNLTWDRLFVECSADSARAIVARGFTLADPQVNWIAFTSVGPPDDRALASPRRDPPPTYSTVWYPDVNIRIGWRLGPDPYYWDGPRRDDGAPVTVRPRDDDAARDTDRGRQSPRDTAGRRPTSEADGDEAPSRGRAQTPDDDSAKADGEDDEKGTSRGGTRRGGTDDDDEDDDDEDDDPSLLPAALAGAALVGSAAIAGGTVGYFGSAPDAPIGLMAGYVRPNAGGLLQVAASPGVFAQDGEQVLVGRLLSFYDLVGGVPVQPALGLGARAEVQSATNDILLEPSVTLGAAGNFGPVVALVGVDVVHGSIEFGLAINFRHKSREGERSVARR